MRLGKEQRFWAKVQKGEPNECWVWIGARHGSRQKRGMFWDGEKRSDAARWLWQHAFGQKLGPDEVVMHSCDNPLCVNPRHLHVGTQADNVADMWRKGRANREAIRAGGDKGRAKLLAEPERFARGEKHGLYGKGIPGERNGQSRLTADVVREIRALAETHTQREIAAKFNVNQATVWRVLQRKAWAHI